MTENKPSQPQQRYRRDSGGIHSRRPAEGTVSESATESSIALRQLGRLDSIINRSPAVFFRWRIADGWPVEFVSDNIDQFGYTADELMSGRVSWQSITHSDDVLRLEAEIGNCLREDKSEFGQEYRLVTKSGDYRWVESRNRTVDDSHGGPTHIDGVVLDVTARRRAEEQLLDKEIELAHVARLSEMEEVAVGLAHELGEPLTAIGSYVEGATLRARGQELNSEELIAVLGEMAAEYDRASKMIHHFRRFARKRAPCRSTANMNELVQDTLLLAAGEIRRAGIEVDTELQEDLPSVCVDGMQIRQCLLNVVRNALDAMREEPLDQRSLTVTTRLLHDVAIEISVSDTGKGFEPDTSESAFKPFFTTKQEGLGVGLSVAQSIVRAHGGKIWARPNSEHGVTCKFTVPVGNEE